MVFLEGQELAHLCTALAARVANDSKEQCQANDQTASIRYTQGGDQVYCWNLTDMYDYSQKQFADYTLQTLFLICGMFGQGQEQGKRTVRQSDQLQAIVEQERFAVFDCLLHTTDLPDRIAQVLDPCSTGCVLKSLLPSAVWRLGPLLYVAKGLDTCFHLDCCRAKNIMLSVEDPDEFAVWYVFNAHYTCLLELLVSSGAARCCSHLAYHGDGTPLFQDFLGSRQFMPTEAFFKHLGPIKFDRIEQRVGETVDVGVGCAHCVFNPKSKSVKVAVDYATARDVCDDKFATHVQNRAFSEVMHLPALLSARDTSFYGHADVPMLFGQDVLADFVGGGIIEIVDSAGV